MLFGVGLGGLRARALLDGRQACFAIFVGVIVEAFAIERKEAVKRHDRAGRAHGQPPAIGFQIDRGALGARAFHLAGDRALPDQLVETGLIVLRAQR